ncbi:unnamed protein product [Pleuronectes platessa]|uniref:Uncharacterized protein n=1 Tax=Pleuronectes platessa TaxID=8262 RepID=A0A9N7ZFE0_PLEPL|nr:unnamed protein product [Pleuronectes platessa]
MKRSVSRAGSPAAAEQDEPPQPEESKLQEHQPPTPEQPCRQLLYNTRLADPSGDGRNFRRRNPEVLLHMSLTNPLLVPLPLRATAVTWTLTTYTSTMSLGSKEKTAD